MKIATVIITSLLNLAIGVVVLAMMLLAMNGFNESDGQWGVYAYLVLLIVMIACMSFGATIFAGWLGKKEMHAFVVVLIASILFSVIGAILISISGFVGIMIADVVRRNF